MFKLLVVLMSLLALSSAAHLPTGKYLNLATIKTMVAAAEPIRECPVGLFVVTSVVTRCTNIDAHFINP